MSAITLNNVSKRFGQKLAVDALSVDVPDGSLCGFIGPNGSGKTTTLRIITRIYPPDAGDVIVLGQPHHVPSDDRVGYLPEERMLYRHMRVYEVVTYLSQLKGYRPTRAEIDDWLERLSLPGVGRQRVQTLSKGQTQKVQLIAVLIARPKLLILDEPFSGLDPVNAAVLRDVIIDIHRTGTPIIFSTHDMAVAEEICDNIVMIFNGRKVLDGSMSQLRKQNSSDSVRVRLTSGTLFPQNIEGVLQVRQTQRFYELHLAPSADTQEILDILSRAGRLELFEIVHPTLADIFVRIANESDMNNTNPRQSSRPSDAATSGGTAWGGV